MKLKPIKNWNESTFSPDIIPLNKNLIFKRKFKIDSNENLGKYFAKDNPVLVEEAKTKYNTIVYELETKNFTWGFDKLADTEKNVIINHVLEKENLIRVLISKGEYFVN